MFKAVRRKILTPDLVLLFIILSVINFKHFFLSCVSYLNLSFNSQIPLTWDFTSLGGLLPYKDVYYPYGILFYLKNTNPFLSFIYFLLPTLLFLSIYVTFKKISGNKAVAFFLFISFYLFVYKYAGIENYSRYGIILSFVLLFSYIFYKFRSISLKTAFFVGVLVGGVFSLVNDQGIYSFLLFIFLLILIPFFKRGKLHFFNFEISRLSVCVLGVLVGFLPFLIFLISNNMVYEFYLFVKQMPDFILYSKTPFIPFSTTPDNLFAFGSIFVAIVILCYKIFFFRKKLSFFLLLETSLVFVLVLLEQKNIVRSIDRQITFIAFFLYLTMFYEFIKNKVNNFFAVLCIALFSLFIILGFGLHPFINYNLNFEKDLMNHFLRENMDVFLTEKNMLCLNDNLNRLIIGKNTKLEKVKNMIEKDSDGYFRIFDYLADPVFYLLFNQKPPYYFTIFEATSLYAQKSNIKFINENKVKYVIYNADVLKVQDGVPNYARSRVLYGYLLGNFTIMGKVGNYLIYKR